MTHATKNDRKHFTKSYATVDDAKVCPFSCRMLAELYIESKPHPLADIELDQFKAWIFREFHNHRLGEILEMSDSDVTPEEMLANWQSKKVLLVSTANSEHPYLSVSDNVRFRAVHDWHHIAFNCGFDFAGEYKTFEMAIKSAPRSIWWVLFSEIVLQAAACIHTGEFQPQKLVRHYCF